LLKLYRQDIIKGLLKQLFRRFYKSRWGFRIDYKMEMDNIINNGDIIYLYSRIKKAGFRKLLLRCDYELMDYKILKNRKYKWQKYKFRN
jgi:hypothetical protein